MRRYLLCPSVFVQYVSKKTLLQQSNKYVHFSLYINVPAKYIQKKQLRFIDIYKCLIYQWYSRQVTVSVNIA